MDQVDKINPISNYPYRKFYINRDFKQCSMNNINAK